MNGVVETSTPEDDKKPSLEVTTETSTTATGTTFEDSPKKETTTVEEASTKEEKKEATPQVTHRKLLSMNAVLSPSHKINVHVRAFSEQFPLILKSRWSSKALMGLLTPLKIHPYNLC